MGTASAWRRQAGYCRASAAEGAIQARCSDGVRSESKRRPASGSSSKPSASAEDSLRAGRLSKGSCWRPRPATRPIPRPHLGRRHSGGKLLSGRRRNSSRWARNDAGRAPGRAGRQHFDDEPTNYPRSFYHARPGDGAGTAYEGGLGQGSGGIAAVALPRCGEGDRWSATT
jgi:hypothetical protein